jgi:hypothetical protein
MISSSSNICLNINQKTIFDDVFDNVFIQNLENVYPEKLVYLFGLVFTLKHLEYFLEKNSLTIDSFNPIDFETFLKTGIPLPPTVGDVRIDSYKNIVYVYAKNDKSKNYEWVKI